MLKGAFLVPHPPLIIPEVGGGRQKTIQKTVEAYRKVAEHIGDLKPDVLVIATPHGPSYEDCFTLQAGGRASGSFADFGAPQVRMEVRCDGDLAGRISRLAGREGLPALASQDDHAALDHGTLIPLYFIKARGLDIPVVRVSVSGLSSELHRNLGRCIALAAEELGRSFVFIASGDLSHKLSKEGPYGFLPRALFSTAGSARPSRLRTFLVSSPLMIIFSTVPRSAGCGRCRSWPEHWTAQKSKPKSFLTKRPSASAIWWLLFLRSNRCGILTLPWLGDRWSITFGPAAFRLCRKGSPRSSQTAAAELSFRSRSTASSGAVSVRSSRSGTALPLKSFTMP